jgi:hypothetical protein
MNRSRIFLGLALALVATLAHAQPAFVQKEAGGPYVKEGSPYLGYVQLAQCTVEGLVQADCGGRIYVDPAKFPNNSSITWSVPYRATKSGLPWGYLALSRGQPSGGRPAVIDPPKRVDAVASLTIKLDAELSLMGPGSDATVINDTFFYDPTFKSIVGEIGVMPHIGTAARAWMMKLPPIKTGIATIGGRSWIARRADKYYVFTPQRGDALKGDIDLKAFIDFVMGAGLLTGDMIYPGTALGVEPGAGAGTLKVNTFEVGPG